MRTLIALLKTLKTLTPTNALATIALGAFFLMAAMVWRAWERQFPPLAASGHVLPPAEKGALTSVEK
ncbi:hypothetical protein [Myxococcus sp. CA039A]|uniref:hypothetical protein n=1 Tax=Myxococcus sp. CA039A TaxID=2741737 RepID=UPI00157B79D1|nr:hypothetical protein [Myxococcus sp. CA039A]NTX54622.1 hypothetical protein [Myxococcus sp. CA039A]